MNITFQFCVFSFITVCCAQPYRGAFSSSASSSFASSSSSISSSIHRRSSSSSLGQPPKPQPWSWNPPKGSWNHPPPRGTQGTVKPWNMGTTPQGVVSPKYTSTTPPSILNKGGYSTQTPPTQNSVSVSPEAGCRVGAKTYRVGDKWTDEGGCGRQSCTGNGKVSVLGCPSPEPTEQCALTKTDPRQPWPQCCPQLKCKE